MNSVGWPAGRIVYATWLDVLPLEIQQHIWRLVNQETLKKLAEFRMYRGILRLYMKKAFGNEIKDLVFSRDNKAIILREGGERERLEESVVYRGIDSVEKLSGLFQCPPSATPTDAERLKRNWCSGPKTVVSEFTSCGILDARIVDNLAKAYGLCKPIMEDWSAIGRWDERAASRYTYAGRPP